MLLDVFVFAVIYVIYIYRCIYWAFCRVVHSFFTRISKIKNRNQQLVLEELSCYSRFICFNLSVFFSFVVGFADRQRPEVEVKDPNAARKVQKADREKLRRDRLNEHFIELGNALGTAWVPFDFHPFC